MSKRPNRSAARVAVRPAPVPPLYRFGLQFFAVFSLAMLLAFWPSYFSRLGSQPSLHPHAHGLTMTLWVGLMVSQAWLIRSGNRATHRKAGLLSYALVPSLVVAALTFMHYRLRGVAVLDDPALYFMALVVNALVAFLVLYGLAMWFRRQPAIHARFMIAALFPLFTPVTDRLIGRYVPADRAAGAAHRRLAGGPHRRLPAGRCDADRAVRVGLAHEPAARVSHRARGAGAVPRVRADVLPVRVLARVRRVVYVLAAFLTT